jgi:D-alanine-D-alanine ligase
VVNEVNTMPGFTPISMFPMLWEAEGLPFRAVVEELVTLARARHARRRLLRTHRVV